MATRVECLHCGLAMDPIKPDMNHWEVCPKHPAKHEIDHLLKGLHQAVEWFNRPEPDGLPIWADAAEHIQENFVEKMNDGRKRR